MPIWRFEILRDPNKIIKIAFLAGAVTDAAAILPMVFPQIAEIIWGFSAFSKQYFFAMGYGATFMLAWTFLLIWAYFKPKERNFVAPLTMIVIIGFFVTELYLILDGLLDPIKLIPTWILKIALLSLFSIGYCQSIKEE